MLSLCIREHCLLKIRPRSDIVELNPSSTKEVIFLCSCVFWSHLEGIWIEAKAIQVLNNWESFTRLELIVTDDNGNLNVFKSHVNDSKRYRNTGNCNSTLIFTADIHVVFGAPCATTETWHLNLIYSDLYTLQNSAMKVCDCYRHTLWAMEFLCKSWVSHVYRSHKPVLSRC